MEKDLSIALIANGEPAKQIDIMPDTSDIFRLISLRHLVKAGENTITLEPSGKGNLAYQIVAVHYLPWQEEKLVSSEQELTIDVTYDTTTLKKGDTLEVQVNVECHRPGTAELTIVNLGSHPFSKCCRSTFRGSRMKG